MRSLLLITLTFLIFSCKHTAVEEKLYSADSVMVQFFDDKSGMIYNAVTSTEKAAIKKLASFMDSRAVTPIKCGSSGKVQFFSKHQLILDATYIDKTDCRYFSYEVEGKLQHVAMSNEAADFLKSLAPPK